MINYPVWWKTDSENIHKHKQWKLKWLLTADFAGAVFGLFVSVTASIQLNFYICILNYQLNDQ